MIIGVHAIVYSRQADKVKAFLGAVLGFASVDAGDDWPIFAGPPLEIAVHPTEGEPGHELYFMCDDIYGALAKLAAHGVEIAQPVVDRGWGLAAQLRLPGGEEIGMYEPRHPSPIAHHPSAAQ
jgi:predicted enzyme related to lactoylglutathione lyase